MTAITLPDELIEALAAAVAPVIATSLASASDTPNGYLNAEQAAAYLGCTGKRPAKRIYDLAREGRLAHYNDGRRLLFTREDLDAVLEKTPASE